MYGNFMFLLIEISIYCLLVNHIEHWTLCCYVFVFQLYWCCWCLTQTLAVFQLYHVFQLVLCILSNLYIKDTQWSLKMCPLWSVALYIQV